MESSTHTFPASTRRLRNYLIGAGIVMSLLMTGTAALAAPALDGFMIVLVAGMVATVWLVILPLTGRFAGGALRRLRLHVGPEGLCRQDGAVKQMVPWGEITRVRCRQHDSMLNQPRHRERWERMEQDPQFGRVLRTFSWLRPRPPMPHAVEVFTAEGQALYLVEFERLDEVARLLQAGVSPHVPIERVGLFG